MSNLLLLIQSAKSHLGPSFLRPATPTLTRSAHVTSIWLAILSYTCTIWFTRISIVFSMVRIVPPTKRVSITAFGTGAMFLCLWAYVLTCKSVVCSADKSWYDATVIQCPIPRWVALSEVTSTFCLRIMSSSHADFDIRSRCILRHRPRDSPPLLSMACEVAFKSENHGPFRLLD